MERGWEEDAIWRDLVGKERRWTLYIWRALKSHYANKLRKGTYEEEKKVYEIIDRLKEKEDRELESFSDEEKKKLQWSFVRWRDELIPQMNHTAQLNNWKHILVSIYAICYSPVLYYFGSFFCEYNLYMFPIMSRAFCEKERGQEVMKPVKWIGLQSLEIAVSHQTHSNLFSLPNT